MALLKYDLLGYFLYTCSIDFQRERIFEPVIINNSIKSISFI